MLRPLPSYQPEKVVAAGARNNTPKSNVLTYRASACNARI